MNGSAISLTSRADIRRVMQPFFLQGVLQGDAVDHGGQHAHVVGGGAVDAQLAGPDAAEKIAAAGDDGDLDSQVVDFLDLGSDAADDVMVDAERVLALQGFAAELQQDRACTWRLGVSHVTDSSPI